MNEREVMDAREGVRQQATEAAYEVVYLRSIARLGEPNGRLKEAHHSALDVLERLAAEHPDDPHVAACEAVAGTAPYVRGSLQRSGYLDWLDREIIGERV